MYESFVGGEIHTGRNETCIFKAELRTYLSTSHMYVFRDICRSRFGLTLMCWHQKVRRQFALTICNLQLSLGEDAARDRQGLADIVTGVGPLHGRDGEVSAGRH